MVQTKTNVLSGGGMNTEEKHQEIVLVVMKFIILLKITFEHEKIESSLYIKIFHCNVGKYAVPINPAIEDIKDLHNVHRVDLNNRIR